MARDYTALVTSEHRNATRFMATISASTTPFGQVADCALSLPVAFDLDLAAGVQLDQIGLWVGASRQVAIILTTYFAFDTLGQGFDQGIWYQVGDDVSVLSSLNDSQFRFLIRAKIACNSWDGSQVGAYNILANLLGASAASISIRTSSLAALITITGTLTTIVQALLSGGYVPLAPVGVTVSYRFVNPAASQGLGANSNASDVIANSAFVAASASTAAAAQAAAISEFNDGS